ncbi:hypothetical protein EDF75_0655 [Raoultella sp. BIGb0149]|nr:hypothetical protein EDF75_0655 [Raoultella sp. BIGb0149]
MLRKTLASLKARIWARIYQSWWPKMNAAAILTIITRSILPTLSVTAIS